MDRADLAGLSADAAAGALWLRLADGDGQNSAVDAASDTVGGLAPDASVSGLASERAALDSVLPARRAARTSAVAAIAG